MRPVGVRKLVVAKRTQVGMDISRFTFNPFQTNCFICRDASEAVIIDPSSESEAEHDVLLDHVEKSALTVRKVLLTHAHIDHILGLSRICQALEVPYFLHRADLPLIDGAAEQGRLFGIDLTPPPPPHGFLGHGDTVAVGGGELRVVHTPGHSPGSITFVDESSRTAIGGDVLFAGSIGRTDLWQASLPQLMRSIFDEIVPLGRDFKVCPGHGPDTTVGDEMDTNPFLTGSLAFD